MMNLLERQIAVVTGASSGIGKAIAVSLSMKGALPCLVGRQESTLSAVARMIESDSSKARTYPADLTEDDDIAKLVCDFRRDFEGVDILVHSAGIWSYGSIESAPVSDLDMQYRTNVRGPYLLTQQMIPLLREKKGQVVFINSSAGLNARANISQYSATKHALKAIADAFRQEVNHEGIRVLSVYPGRTATPLQLKVSKKEECHYHPELLLQAADVAEAVVSALVLPRTAEVTDIQLRPLSSSHEREQLNAD